MADPLDLFHPSHQEILGGAVALAGLGLAAFGPGVESKALGAILTAGGLAYAVGGMGGGQPGQGGAKNPALPTAYASSPIGTLTSGAFTVVDPATGQSTRGQNVLDLTTSAGTFTLPTGTVAYRRGTLGSLLLVWAVQNQSKQTLTYGMRTDLIRQGAPASVTMLTVFPTGAYDRNTATREAAGLPFDLVASVRQPVNSTAAVIAPGGWGYCATAIVLDLDAAAAAQQAGIFTGAPNFDGWTIRAQQEIMSTGDAVTTPNIINHAFVVKGQ